MGTCYCSRIGAIRSKMEAEERSWSGTGLAAGAKGAAGRGPGASDRAPGHDASGGTGRLTRRALAVRAGRRQAWDWIRCRLARNDEDVLSPATLRVRPRRRWACRDVDEFDVRSGRDKVWELRDSLRALGAPRTCSGIRRARGTLNCSQLTRFARPSGGFLVSWGLLPVTQGFLATQHSPSTGRQYSQTLTGRCDERRERTAS